MALGCVGQQLQHLEVRPRLLGLAGLELGHGQRLAGGGGIGALGVDQGGQPFLQSWKGSCVQKREGGFEAGHVADHRTGRGLGGLVEQLDGFLGLALLLADARLLHQRQGLVATRRRLGGLTELGEGLVCIPLGEGVQGGGIVFGGLGVLGRAPALVAPGAQGDQQGGQGDADGPRHGLAEELTVSIRAELLLDLF